MDRQLEQTRDGWINAFFIGNYEVLAQFEAPSFKVIYEKEGITESSVTRYEKIAHAVQNGVWKLQKLEISSEEFEFDREQTRCKVTLELENEARTIQEYWIYDLDWKIIELRFCKVRKVQEI